MGFLVTIKGTLVSATEPVEGVSKSGSAWIKQSFIIEQAGERYTSQVAVEVFGKDRILQFVEFPPGSPVDVDCSVDSREYNGRWYTEVRGISIRPMGAAHNPGTQQQPQPQPQRQVQQMRSTAEQFAQQYQQNMQQQPPQGGYKEWQQPQQPQDYTSDDLPF